MAYWGKRVAEAQERTTPFRAPRTPAYFVPPPLPAVPAGEAPGGLNLRPTRRDGTVRPNRRNQAGRKQLCTQCRTRWKQDRSGLCRACARAAGVEMRTVREIDAARAQRTRELLDSLRPVALKDGPATIRRTVVADGVEYEVVWP